MTRGAGDIAKILSGLRQSVGKGRLSEASRGRVWLLLYKEGEGRDRRN